MQKVCVLSKNIKQMYWKKGKKKRKSDTLLEYVGQNGKYFAAMLLLENKFTQKFTLCMSRPS